MTRFSLLLFACFLTIGLRAQDEEKKLIFGFYTGLSDYYGELNTQFFNIDKAVRVQFGGSLFYNINPSFNAGLDVGLDAGRHAARPAPFYLRVEPFFAAV